ncbi:MAG: lecithin retinol acyltransferase family protein [bacterium]
MKPLKIITGIAAQDVIDRQEGDFWKILKKLARWSRRNPVKGDHIRVSRVIYYHHGIYIGNGKVIHYNTHGSGDGLLGDARVICTSLDDFLEGGSCGVRNYFASERKSLYSPNSIVRRAKSKLGQEGYNLIFNNCEHFANWCTTGKRRSEQVEDLFDIINRLND